MEDIIDTGKTLQSAVQAITFAGAASVKVCVLLDKAERRITDIQPDFTALEVDLPHTAVALIPMQTLHFSAASALHVPKRAVIIYTSRPYISSQQLQYAYLLL